jgi:conserved transporter
MKKFLIIFFLNLMMVGNIHATNSSQMKFQQKNMSNMKAITLPENSKKARHDTVFVLKEFPFFRGDFNEFIFSNFHYPPSLQENCIQGRLVVKFCINPKGKCDHFSIVRSVDPLIDKEVLRVLKLMPKWKWRIRTKKCLWMVKAVEFQLR